MWLPSIDPAVETASSDDARRAALIRARRQLREMLAVLDLHSTSAAAASVDLALHQLDRELSDID